MSEVVKILIVEDELLIAHDMKMQLIRLGFSVLAPASSAREAIERIEPERPDLVFMDIRIEGEQDGIEAAQVLRRQYGLPVVFLTAHADAATLERAQASQPLGYLTKPFTNVDLKAVVEMALLKHRTERESANQSNIDAAYGSPV